MNEDYLQHSHEQGRHEQHRDDEDRVYTTFLAQQHDAAMALAEESDILDLVPHSGHPVARYVALFRCRGFALDRTGKVTEAERFAIGITFPPDYLEIARQEEILTVLSPDRTWHPNVSAKAPFMCANVRAGTELVSLLYQIWEILTWNRVTMREDDALNSAACAWARHNPDRFPVDDRPLKRRAPSFRVEIATPGKAVSEEER